MRKIQQIEKQDRGGWDTKLFKLLVLGSMCLNSISNIMLSTIVSPIWYQVAIYYNTNDYDLNWIVGWYYFGPILFCFPFNAIIIYNYGLSQILSCICSSIGLWILVSVKRDFQLGMLGFAFLGIGEALYCQTPLYLSKIWFNADERIFTTFVAQYANNVGCLIGYLVSFYYFFEIYDEIEFNIRFENLIFINAILATSTIIISFISLKSPYNSLDKIQIRDSIWVSLKKICSQWETFLDVASVSTFIGISWCYILLFGTQQYYMQYTPEEICLTNVTFSIGQLIAALICSYKLNSQSQKGLQQTYDTFIKFTISLGFFFLMAENLTFEFLPFQLVILMNFFIGAGLGGIYSILLESLMEKHYPAQELAISTLLVVVACALSFSIGMISIIPQFLTYGFYISCFFMIPSFCYILVFYKTKYKRFEFEA
ncbi:unnamed protein product [Paramecium primaurelia]|uniref:Uncharacterized protein n=1 Tax=Paramecium primaurelia TaxID=5886 RepID=A0A8S1KGF5_PARPR|nr:unnamed protein product [Paramecium primaurelia]